MGTTLFKSEEFYCLLLLLIGVFCTFARTFWNFNKDVNEMQRTLRFANLYYGKSLDSRGGSLTLLVGKENGNSNGITSRDSEVIPFEIERGGKTSLCILLLLTCLYKMDAGTLSHSLIHSSRRIECSLLSTTMT